MPGWPVITATTTSTFGALVLMEVFEIFQYVFILLSDEEGKLLVRRFITPLQEINVRIFLLVAGIRYRVVLEIHCRG